MAVYVSELQSTPITPSWPYSTGCHMFSGDRHKLHDMAYKLGIHSSTFRNDPHFPHYNLTAGKRNQALMLGAIEQSYVETELFKKGGIVNEVLCNGD